MKQQVVTIHGGTSFHSYDEYINYLQTREIALEGLQQTPDWKMALAGDLGEGFEVLSPRMPNGTNARYVEWHIWFERCAEFMRDGVILIGHSLGGIFLAKYLAENSLQRVVKATVLVATPFDGHFGAESLVDFALPDSLKRLADRGGNIYLVHSTDDPVVPFGEALKYQRSIPSAEILSFDDRGHFNQANFPEVVQLVASLA